MQIGWLLVILFFVLVLQDIRYRHINGWMLIPAFMLLTIYTIEIRSAYFMMINAAISLSFLVVQLILLSLFYLIKDRQIKVVDVKIGLGDILLLVVLTVGFSYKSYIIFYIETLSICLLITFALVLVSKKRYGSIPLAAYIGGNWIVWFITSLLIKKNIFFL